jgi:hypothetical protein
MQRFNQRGMPPLLFAVATLHLGCWVADSVSGQEKSKSKITKANDPVFERSWPPATANKPAELYRSKPRPGQILRFKVDATPIRDAGTFAADLSTSDAVHGKRFADLYSYNARRGERIEITLTSSAFDAYLLVGYGPPSSFVILGYDDDSAEGESARLSYVAPADGDYAIVATSIARPRKHEKKDSATGPYTIGLISRGIQAETIVPGKTVAGRLQLTDATLTSDPALPDDDSYYDTWLFEGKGGDSLTVTMTSDQFDSYLLIGAGTPGGLTFLKQDDDGAGGTDARLTMILPDSGLYSILANSSTKATGSYQLNLEIRPPDYAKAYPGGGDPNDRYALLVGIDEYHGTGDLTSCVADVKIMKDLLIKRFGYNEKNVVTLINYEANRSHILHAFSRHLGQAGPQGTALFYYSGHGMQMDGNHGRLDPERDGIDEALYVWSLNRQGGVIMDDEIEYLVDQLKAGQVLLIHDSCHSGTSAQAVGLAEPKEVAYKQVSKQLYLPRQILGAKEEYPFLGTLESKKRYGLLAGCKDDEQSWTAKGWPERGGVASVFTYYLVSALDQPDEGQAPFERLCEGVRDKTLTYVQDRHRCTQTPQVSGPLAKETVASFFGQQK